MNFHIGLQMYLTNVDYSLFFLSNPTIPDEHTGKEGFPKGVYNQIYHSHSVTLLWPSIISICTENSNELYCTCSEIILKKSALASLASVCFMVYTMAPIDTAFSCRPCWFSPLFLSSFQRFPWMSAPIQVGLVGFWWVAGGAGHCEHAIG